jgi:hypothetical protein
MEGKALISKVLEATGLPSDSLGVEFKKIIDGSNANEETLTLEQLRELLASYLQDVLVEAKDEAS